MKLKVDGEVLEFAEDSLKNTEAIKVQRATGYTVPEWLKAARAGDALAITGLVWLARLRRGESLDFDDVEFNIATLSRVDDKKAADADEDDAEAPAGKPRSTRRSNNAS